MVGLGVVAVGAGMNAAGVDDKRTSGPKAGDLVLIGGACVVIVASHGMLVHGLAHPSSSK